MKKILIVSFSLIAIIGFNACKKKNEVVSQLEIYSEPTILISGAQFFSIPLNGALPTIVASAYDSVRKEACPITINTSTLDNTKPGLYSVPIRATNSVGMYKNKNVYVAVTGINPSWNLAGEYRRSANNALVNVLEVANGLYEVDNVGGAPTLAVIGYFVHLNDSTIDFPLQPTDNVGDIDCTSEKLVTLQGDTSYSWFVKNPNFGTANRLFVKQ